MQEKVLITRPSNIVLIAGVFIAILFPLAASLSIGSSALSLFDKALYSRFIYWIDVVFLLWYATLYENRPLFIWAERQSGAKFISKWVILLYLLSLVAATLSLIPRWLGFHDNKDIIYQIAQMVKGHPVFIVFISLTAGVTEEIIFRGYILTRLSLLFKNQYTPIIVSAILFAALHYKYQSVREYIFTFLIGILMGLHYKKYGNIKPLIIVHFMVDLISLTLMQHYIK